MNCNRVSLAFKDGTHANDKRPLSQIWTSFAYQLQESFQLQRWCSFPIDLNFSFKYHPLQKWGWICTSKIWTESVWDASRSVLGSINNIERARVCELKSLDPDRPLSASARVFWLHPITFTFWATFEPRLLSAEFLQLGKWSMVCLKVLTLLVISHWSTWSPTSFSVVDERFLVAVIATSLNLSCSFLWDPSPWCWWDPGDSFILYIK